MSDLNEFRTKRCNLVVVSPSAPQSPNSNILLKKAGIEKYTFCKNYFLVSISQKLGCGDLILISGLKM